MAFIFEEFAKHPNVKYGFSSRVDGSMNRQLMQENRNSFIREIGGNPSRLVTPDQVHSARVERVTDEAGGKWIAETDALVTNAQNLFLSATGADCSVVFFYDPQHHAAGIAHVGWRGLLAGVVKNTLNAMATNFGMLPQEVLVGIGPGIRVCHFEISAVDKDKFQEYPEFIFENDGKIFIDLAGILRFQLLSVGVIDQHIEDSGECTYCEEEKYFSYRRDKPKDVQSMIGYICLS